DRTMVFSRRTLSLATVVVVLGALGAAAEWRLRGAAAEAEAGAASPPGGVAAQVAGLSAPSQFSTDVPQPVAGVAAVRDTLWIRVTAAGQAEASRRATVTARVEGWVRAVPARENGAVAEGDPLVAIDSTEYALRLAQARADLLTAQADFEQLVLFDDEIEDDEVRADRRRIARARSGLDQREVDLRRAEMELERTRARAPFAGRVADLQVVEGQYVTPGAELLTVVDLD